MPSVLIKQSEIIMQGHCCNQYIEITNNIAGLAQLAAQLRKAF